MRWSPGAQSASAAAAPRSRRAIEAASSYVGTMTQTAGGMGSGSVVDGSAGRGRARRATRGSADVDVLDIRLVRAGYLEAGLLDGDLLVGQHLAAGDEDASAAFGAQQVERLR